MGQHFGLGMELGLVFGVIHLGVPRGHDQHALVPDQKREGLGNALALHAQGLGRQLHGGTGNREFLNAIFYSLGRKIGPYLFNGHWRVPPGFSKIFYILP